MCAISVYILLLKLIILCLCFMNEKNKMFLIPLFCLFSFGMFFFCCKHTKWMGFGLWVFLTHKMVLNNNTWHTLPFKPFWSSNFLYILQSIVNDLLNLYLWKQIMNHHGCSLVNPKLYHFLHFWDPFFPPLNLAMELL